MILIGYNTPKFLNICEEISLCFVYLFSAKDATDAFELEHHSDEARELMKSFYVGQYLDVRIFKKNLTYIFRSI